MGIEAAVILAIVTGIITGLIRALDEQGGDRKI